MPENTWRGATATMTKAEELAVLRDFAAAQQPGTYLASLLSKELLEWVEREMRNDFSCDVMVEVGVLNRRVYQLQSEVYQLQAKIEGYKAREHQLRKILD